MHEKIKENIHQPEELERLYRSDSQSFTSAFEETYSQADEGLVNFWKIRLAYDRASGKVKTFQWADIAMVLAACLVTSLLIKYPDIFNSNLSGFPFYLKNAGMIVLFGLSIYAIWTNKITGLKKIASIVLSFLVPAVYINLLPYAQESQSLNLAFIHLPILMWVIYGIVYMGLDFKDMGKRMDFIRYNADMAVITALLLIAEGILTTITIGLFAAIDIHIEDFYMENVAICGLVSAPIVATYILQNYAAFTNKIVPVIANIFSPLVLITLVIYLATIPITGKSPYSNRDILIVFNLMLLGVMGIIVFSISETSPHKNRRFNDLILFILSVVTLVIDLVALSAIFYRLSAFGITPNRVTVLVSNLLISGNLVWIMVDLYRINFKNAGKEKVELTISRYLPLYALYAFLVVFGFPLLFGMK